MKYLYLIGSLLLFHTACNALMWSPKVPSPPAKCLKTKTASTAASMALIPPSVLATTAALAASSPIWPPTTSPTRPMPRLLLTPKWDNNSILPETSVDGIWSAIYDGINVANNVIAQVPSIGDMTDAEKNAALGELYFIRALNHFNLLNYFGAIPMKLPPPWAWKT